MNFVVIFLIAHEKCAPSLVWSLPIRIFSIGFSGSGVDSTVFGVCITSTWTDDDWLLCKDNAALLSGTKTVSKCENILID